MIPEEAIPGFNELKAYYMKNLEPLIDEFVVMKLKLQDLHSKGLKNTTVGLSLDSIVSEIITTIKML